MTTKWVNKTSRTLLAPEYYRGMKGNQRGEEKTLFNSFVLDHIITVIKRNAIMIAALE